MIGHSCAGLRFFAARIVPAIESMKKETQPMKSTLRLMVVGAFALLVCVPAAFAQTPESSTLPVTEPLDVGGTILQPGNYVIRVLPSSTDRNKVQITSPDFQTVFATLLTVPHPLEPNEEIPNTTFLFYPAGEGLPRALRTWFAPNPPTLTGHDIVYDEARAKQLARLAKSKVVFYPAETVVAEVEIPTLQVITPEATVETYVVPTRQTTMVSTATETEMPATAGKVPLIALLGLLSIGGAVALRIARPE
jgi:hypothetical protein